MTFQRVIPALFALAVLGCGTVTAQTLTVGNVQGKPGDTVPVVLATDAAAKNVANLKFTLDFGSGTPSSSPSLAVQNASALTPGPYLPAATLSETLPTPTSLAVTLTAATNSNGAGTVLTVPIYIPDNAPIGATYALHLTGLTATDMTGAATPLTGADGVLTVSTSSGSAGGMLSPGIVVSPATAAPGGAAAVEITATTTFQNIAALSISLQFDPSLAATMADVTVGDLLNGYSSVNDLTAGKLVIGVVVPKGVNGPGHIAEVKFHIPATAKSGATFPIQVTDVQAVDGSLNLVPTLGTGSSITVSAPALAKGDLNGDGVVDIKDVTMALQAAVKLITLNPQQIAAADFNGDGAIEITEVTKLLRVALHLDTFG